MRTADAVRARTGRRSIVLIAAMCLSATASAAPAQAAPETAGTKPSAFEAVEPCRLLDTRGTSRVDADSVVDVEVTGNCGVADDAVAVAVTVTAIEPDGTGFLTSFPTGLSRPEASTVNYGAGDVVANHQFVQLGASGNLSIYTRAEADIVIDVSGFFTPAIDGVASAGRYVSVEPRRLIDTRSTGRPDAGATIRVDADLPTTAIAVAVNITTADTQTPGYFTAFAAESSRPLSSVLTVDGVGQVRAAAAVVPVGVDGFDIFTSGSNHMMVDIVGYFTDDSAELSSDGLFVPMTPTRLVDTRRAAGPSGGPRLWDHGTREFSTTAVGADGAAIAANVTLTRTEDVGFVTAYPARTERRSTSTVNADRPGQTVANFALVGVSTSGVSFAAFEATHLVVDVTGWFTGSPQTAAPDAPLNSPSPDRRVVIVSDSAMAGVRWNGALGGLQGFDAVTSLESCRRLVEPSCRGREGYRPSTAAAFIDALPIAGPEQILVIAVGYNDWHERFATDFDTVIEVARRRGFRHIAWVDYRSDVGYALPGTGGQQSNYGAMNRVLDHKLASGAFPEVRRWRLNDYTRGASAWFTSDGVHETRIGSWGVADWLSRHVRAFDDRPCVQPWVAGGGVENRCPNPDVVRSARGVPNIETLYPQAAG